MSISDSFHGLQLWINLPTEKKRIDPQYQDLQGTDVAMVTSGDGGAVLRVLAGEIAGHQGPGISHTPIAIAHLTLAPGAQIDIPWRSDFNALAYALAGFGSVGAEQHPVHTGQMAVLVNGDAIRVRAADQQESRSPNPEMFILGGVPLRQPTVQDGPCVMSTPPEAREA